MDEVLVEYDNVVVESEFDKVVGPEYDPLADEIVWEDKRMPRGSKPQLSSIADDKDLDEEDDLGDFEDEEDDEDFDEDFDDFEDDDFDDDDFEDDFDDEDDFEDDDIEEDDSPL